MDSGKRQLSVWSEISAILLCSESFFGKMAATPVSTTVSSAPTLKEGWLQKRGEGSGCGEGEDGRRLGVHLVGTRSEDDVVCLGEAKGATCSLHSIPGVN